VPVSAVSNTTLPASVRATAPAMSRVLPAATVIALVISLVRVSFTANVPVMVMPATLISIVSVVVFGVSLAAPAAVSVTSSQLP
jgi:hypothetical protein